MQLVDGVFQHHTNRKPHIKYRVATPSGLFASPSYRSHQHSRDRKLIVTNQLTIMNNNSSTIIY